MNGPLHTSTAQVIYMALGEFPSEFSLTLTKVVAREREPKERKKNTNGEILKYSFQKAHSKYSTQYNYYYVIN